MCHLSRIVQTLTYTFRSKQWGSKPSLHTLQLFSHGVIFRCQSQTAAVIPSTFKITFWWWLGKCKGHQDMNPNGFLTLCSLQIIGHHFVELNAIIISCYLPVFYHGECSMTEIDPCTIIILARQRFSSSQSGSIRSILLSARHPGLTCIFSILNARSVKYFVGKWAKMGRLSGLMVVCRDTGTNFPFKLSFSRGPWGHGKNLTLCPYILRDLNVLRSSSYTFPFLSWRCIWIASRLAPEPPILHSIIGMVTIFRIRGSFSGLLTYFVEKV